DVRATAVEALPEDVEEMIDLFVPAFRDEDERVWRAALSHLAALPKRYLPLVWAALREAASAKREELIRAIEEADPNDLMGLAAALDSPDLRRSAGEVLERMGAMAVQALIEFTSGADAEAAASAGSLLERIAGPGPFVERVASIEPAERLRAVQVLAAMGGPT